MTKVFDFNESTEKGKITKVAESKLVLSADFLFATFSYDLVLTAHVFCVASHESIHNLCICRTPHKNKTIAKC